MHCRQDPGPLIRYTTGPKSPNTKCSPPGKKHKVGILTLLVQHRSSTWIYDFNCEITDSTRNPTKNSAGTDTRVTFAAAFPRSLFTPTTTMSDYDPYELRMKYTRFRILVIGRANAGKTTLLQRVCNTIEDPCIYDDNNKNLVSVHRTKDEFCF